MTNNHNFDFIKLAYFPKTTASDQSFPDYQEMTITAPDWPADTSTAIERARLIGEQGFEVQVIQRKRSR